MKMNGQIEELAEQANLKLDELPDDTFIPLEKFAELIVRECARVILETPVEYTEIDTMHRIRDRVKEHFGVKL